jgi:hypothetical protein
MTPAKDDTTERGHCAFPVRLTRFVTMGFAVLCLTTAGAAFCDGGIANRMFWVWLAAAVLAATLATAPLRPRPAETEQQSLSGIYGTLRWKAKQEMAPQFRCLRRRSRETMSRITRAETVAEVMPALEQLIAEQPESFFPRYLFAVESASHKDAAAVQLAYEECLRFELPHAVHAEVLIGWAGTAVYAGTFCAEEVRARLLEFRSTNPSPLALACVLDGMATFVLSSGCQELLPEAGEWTEETMRLARGEVTIAGTRGSVLIESGHIAEGEALLRDVVQRSADDNDQAISFLYLAIAAKCRGRMEEAEAHAGRARALLMENSLFRHRLELEFPAGRQ